MNPSLLDDEIQNGLLSIGLSKTINEYQELDQRYQWNLISWKYCQKLDKLNLFPINSWYFLPKKLSVELGGTIGCEPGTLVFSRLESSIDIRKPMEGIETTREIQPVPRAMGKLWKILENWVLWESLPLSFWSFLSTSKTSELQKLKSSCCQSSITDIWR